MADGMDAPNEISFQRNEDDSVVVETVSDGGDDRNDDDNNDDGEGFQGRVALHSASSPHRLRRRPSSAGSSWASGEQLRRDALRRGRPASASPYRGRGTASGSRAGEWPEDHGSSPVRPGIRRTKPPAASNLARDFVSELDDSFDPGEEDLTTLLPPTLVLEGEPGTPRSNYYRRQQQKQQQRKSATKPPPSSFRSWLAEGMLDALNVVAGITLSTTGTILSPPIAMTRNVILPAILAMVVDGLDAVTPLRVQDWFRILSSSVYHLFCVLVSGSTPRGLGFRNQVGVVAGSFVEAWSAPESRQVVVDGMATGVKLADALHTPEMEEFLDQLGVLGCRLVDAIASGKSKEFLQNLKDLVWKSIELASDPSTTLALAEVTAHLCHALEEADDSFRGASATPRRVRNAQNERAYGGSALIAGGDHSTEQIILTSLGMADAHHTGNGGGYGGLPPVDDADGGGIPPDDETTGQSIPSNVAFRVDGVATPNLDPHSSAERRGSTHLETCRNRVDLGLLQDRILYGERPRARRSATANRDGPVLPSANASISSNLGNDQPRPGPALEGENETFEAMVEEDMEDLPFGSKLRSGGGGANMERRPVPNLRDLYHKFEAMETKESEQPSYVQFYNAIDDLLKEKRARRPHPRNESTRADSGAPPKEGKKTGRVRRFRGGSVETERATSKAIQERHENLRRLWKYPPSLLRMGALVALLVCSFWVGFGVYGVYTFVHKVVYVDREPASIPSFPVVVDPIYQPGVEPEWKQHQHTHVMGDPLQQHEVESDQQQLNQQEQQQQQQQHHQPQRQQTAEQQQQQESYGFDHATNVAQGNANYASCGCEEGSQKTTSPNELVIRIVKEVVHVREDGSRIEDYQIRKPLHRTSKDLLHPQEDSKKYDRETKDHEVDETMDLNFVGEIDDSKIEDCMVDETADELDYFANDFTKEEIEKVTKCVTANT